MKHEMKLNPKRLFELALEINAKWRMQYFFDTV